MKRTNRNRSSSGKKNEKEVRNARGLKDLAGGRTNKDTFGANELNEFVESRRKGKVTDKVEAKKPEPKREWGSPRPEDETAKDHPARRGGVEKKAGGSQEMFFWSANGPVKRSSSPSSAPTPTLTGQRNRPGAGAVEQKARSKNESFRKNEGFDDDGDFDDPPVKASSPASVHNRSPLVQKLFRASDRLRTPAQDDDEVIKPKRKLTPELENKFEDSDIDSKSEPRGPKGRQGTKKKAKKSRHGNNNERSPKPAGPVYFDDRRTGRDRRAEPRVDKSTGDKQVVQGMVKRHPDGFGFVIPDDPALPDVYVPRNYMSGVMTNDRVEVEVYSSRHADRTFGEIKQILKHATLRVVGAYLPVDQKYGLIQGEGKGWGADLIIAAKDSMNAKEGDIVAVEVISYPGEASEFKGKVIEIIGDLDEPLNDIKRVIFGANIPNVFSGEALKEARKYGKTVTEKETRGREDLRKLPLITIDGATARDFDDAIYVDQQTDGFKLWVAIADVSHYVKPGTTLDDEAYERGTSTYFPNFVVPMLPEELSNDLCSLNPNVDRLCFVCEMDIDFQGTISEFKFYEGVMKSQARVTYGEAQEVIDGRIPPKIKHVAKNIKDAADLAKILMAKRFREGSLDLEIPETQVVVDESGRSTDIIKSERLFAHRLIEEMMLAANICTARFLDEHEIPGIYRIHEEPFEDNIKALQRFLFNFGGNPSMTGGKLQKKITRALQSFEGKPEAQVLNILTLRSMQQAKYSAHNVGHFGLGFSHYSHFTSPIRRYPDLIAHRLIKSELYPAYRKYGMSEEDLATASTMLSGCEQRSVKAERQVISIKKARFIKQFEGQEFDGLISSVAKFGVFVLLRAFDVDGLVKVEELGDDRFVFDEDNLKLAGKRTGISYAIGDAIKIQVVSANTESGKIEFRLAGEAIERAPVRDSKKNRKDIQKRGKTEDDSRRVRKERVSKRRRKT